ncbi:AGE family epimerase/isomerase [Vibrio sp. SS-MA-C1-2]|uniref:AGE family epimerase/isomerase n=1 Tax=Vibrio sp. SS-MA-C1-2 TaxID=2908646 RepID=UPI001F21232C|nr:AGE family epimerase/isomerase [Vibrio sp. SS-MA-C1-2]UJF18273.1 AGE family epimerase/isomerase [Vibrio sp. SS-MA-C1-2]
MSHSQNQPKHLFNIWNNELQTNILPFWMKGLDKDLGGIFTCYSNDGQTLLSENKFTWSQGRFLWNWSRQATLVQNGVCKGDADAFLTQAKKTANFLLDNAFLENGHCAFILSKEGKKLEPVDGEGFDTSFYADCFVAIGFCEYSLVSKDGSFFEKALSMYKQIRGRLANGNIRSEPYPAPEGFEPYAYEMIMLGLVGELLRYAQIMKHSELEYLTVECEKSLTRIFNEFHQQDTLLPYEMRTSGSNRDTLLAKHKTPGHTLENMWFCFHAAELLGCLDHYLPKITLVTKKMWQMGWDNQYGGIYRYTSVDGIQPEGELLGSDPYEKLIMDTWDTKIWWVHSEALYILILLYKFTGDEELLSMYQKTEQYVLDTFPDRVNGEWIQIRDRMGKPLDKVVALPVKDPFHIMRNFQLIIERLYKVS